MRSVNTIAEKAKALAIESANLADQVKTLSVAAVTETMTHGGVDPFIFALTIFVLACFIGYFVVWQVTPALHTPLMSVTNAISGIIIIGAMIAVGAKHIGFSKFVGFISIVLAAINIFGGFVVTYRMLAMFRKKS